MCQPKISGMYCEKGVAMKREERILAGSAVAVRPPPELSTSFAHRGGSFRRGSNHLNYLRQGTALAVPKSRGLQGFDPLRRFESAAKPARSTTDGTPALESTRHRVPSNFIANSLKTKKRSPCYSTQKRGVSNRAYLPQLGNLESHPGSTNRRSAGKLVNIPKENQKQCCA
jgi:hypothetical protein